MKLSAAGAIAAALFLSVLIAGIEGLGSAATMAIVDSSGTVCGVLAGAAPRSIQCSSATGGKPGFTISPNISFDSISGGHDFFCGLRSGGLSFYCWPSANSSSPPPKRVYNGPFPLTDLNVGEGQVSAFQKNASRIVWWRDNRTFPATVTGDYRSLTSGRGFSCGIGNNSIVRCWGSRGAQIEAEFGNLSMTSIVAGASHACGITTVGFLICKGSNSTGQLNVPSASAFEFSALALGMNHTCAIRKPNGTVICWGGISGGRIYFPANDTMLESIVAGSELTCGLITANFTVLCWKASALDPSPALLPLPQILPGICVAERSVCECGVFPNSETLCSGSGIICRSCVASSSIAPAASSKKTSRWWVAFAAVGSVGFLAGICTAGYLIWKGIFRQEKVHNSVQPRMERSPFSSPVGSRIRRQGSLLMRRQRSGPSSFKERAEVFSLAELSSATNGFSPELKIGAGSFGAVYRGKLQDGREVAVKRSEWAVSSRAKRTEEEKESAFQAEVSFLSRLHHKHLVGFVGYCEEREERLLVYEYMTNGALHDHLHSRGGSQALNSSWRARVKILLDASRGVEYLHAYAVPPVIHRDIKSANILLDGDWLARVSDFGLSLEGGHVAVRAAGTLGYVDPEYYGLQQLTDKSDVYGFGVVMLEVLTGRRAIFREGEEGDPVSVVDYAAASIDAGELGRVLDTRVPLLGGEAEALELVAYTAVRCVSLEGKHRPAMSDVVVNLESALALCDASADDSTGSSHYSISLAPAD